MELRYNPYELFTCSTTPAGLYARKKWLNQELTPQWKADYKQRVEALLSNQSPGGSWQESVVETIRHLFDLHLTLREATREIDTALDWLTGLATEAMEGRTPGNELLSLERLHALPFAPGDFATLLTSAALFLSSIFGREEDARVLAMYERHSREIIAGATRLQDWRSINNLLRAFVVHPVYSTGAAAGKLVTLLAGAQEGSGRWGDDLDPYQSVNALAHLDLKDAKPQVIKALGYLGQTQNSDGTWGETDREWNTFLVVHAMRNTGELT
ncbi:MAG: hypothetical protein JXM72_11495 [Deltaproteobacteria bacterium]|nr:hypothetical protein [Deltaproteobacteria bacterium]